MTESEFRQAAGQILRRIEQAADACEGELEADRPGEGILELTCSDDSKIVINQQTAQQEIWVAARSGGFHFVWRDGAWRDGRDGIELFERLRQIATQQGRVDLAL